ncbi:MAG: hypothetical protein IJY01_06925 [Clostridia bacterium]|nr:hypothetical protein [Clostridia bacterium]
MKRLISIIAVLTVLTLSLAGCAEAFDLDKSIEALKAKGLVSQGVLTTEDELDEINRMMSSMIEIMGGDFTVTVTAYQSLIQDNDRTKCVEFITFSTQDEASAYANLYISANPEKRPAKIAQSGCILICTSLDIVEETVKLKFL